MFSSPIRGFIKYRRVFSVILVLFSVSCSSPLKNKYESHEELACRHISSDEKIWERVSSGAHSYRKLGKKFFVPLNMKKVEDAEVVLFNERAAKALGLETPEDMNALQEMILNNFAYMVAPKESSSSDSKQWFATRYLDSESKKRGEALGDGRAAWSGELEVVNATG